MAFFNSSSGTTITEAINIRHISIFGICEDVWHFSQHSNNVTINSHNSQLMLHTNSHDSNASISETVQNNRWHVDWSRYFRRSYDKTKLPRLSAKLITKTTRGCSFGYTDCYVLSAWQSPFSLYLMWCNISMTLSLIGGSAMAVPLTGHQDLQTSPS